MYILAGVDEAGYGPTLGPLVVTLVSLEAPSSLRPRLEEPSGPWRLLDPVAARRPGRGSSRPRVALDDSKVLFRGGAGLTRLEEGVLAFAAAASGRVPQGLDGLLRAICHRPGPALDRIPWYRDRGLRLPMVADRARVRDLGRSIARHLDHLGLRLRIRTLPMPAAQLNEGIRTTGSKATVLFDQIVRLLRARIACRGARTGTRLDVRVDRLGGRLYYGDLLREAFPSAEVVALGEGRGGSSYALTGLIERMDLCFREKADRAELPVALASMVSKYVREVLMAVFNRFWRDGDAALRPTAGYPVDARRFLREIRGRARRLGVRDEELVRLR